MLIAEREREGAYQSRTVVGLSFQVGHIAKERILESFIARCDTWRANLSMENRPVFRWGGAIASIAMCLLISAVYLSLSAITFPPTRMGNAADSN